MFKGFFVPCLLALVAVAAEAQETESDSTDGQQFRVLVGEQATGEDAARTARYVAQLRPMGIVDLAPKILGYNSLQINQSDYPAASYLAGEEGTVSYTLSIDEHGVAIDCRITGSSGFLLLDQATCPAIMDSAVFAPASTKDGPIKSEYDGKATWKIVEPELDTFVLEISMIVGIDGKVSDCEVVKFEGSIPRNFKNETFCGKSSFKGGPYRDDAGVPVAKRVNIVFSSDVGDVGEND